MITLTDGVLIFLVSMFFELIELSLETIYTLNVLLVMLFGGINSCGEVVSIEPSNWDTKLDKICHFKVGDQLGHKV